VPFTVEHSSLLPSNYLTEFLCELLTMSMFWFSPAEFFHLLFSEVFIWVIFGFNSSHMCTTQHTSSLSFSLHFRTLHAYINRQTKKSRIFVRIFFSKPINTIFYCCRYGSLIGQQNILNIGLYFSKGALCTVPCQMISDQVTLPDMKNSNYNFVLTAN
jgi:hypothetical protein